MTTQALWRRVRAYPVFCGGCTLAVLGAVTGGWVLVRAVEGLRHARVEFAQLRVEQLSPQVRPEMVETVGAELAQARAQLHARQEDWPGPPAAEAPERLDVYAELVALAERLRAAAAAAQVALAKEEHFGFGRYANEAPPAAEAGAILAQGRAVEAVVSALLAARPEQLLGVWRESVGGADHGATTGDEFGWEPGRSLRRPGLVETHAVRVAFTGGTTALRTFLNRLAAAPALLVREVAVAPAEQREARRRAGTELGGRRSFTVTVEVATLSGGRATPERAVAGDAIAWAPPRADAVGELFGAGEWDFDAAQRRWTRPPKPAQVREDFGIELLAVQAPPRWRLLGGVGAGADARVLVEDTHSRQSWWLEGGRTDARSGLTLRRLERSRTANGGRTLRAVIDQPGAAEPMVLEAGAGMKPEPAAAVLRLHGRDEPVVVGPGAIVQTAGVRYRIGAVRQIPPGVAVTRLADGGASGETRQLVVTSQ